MVLQSSNIFIERMRFRACHGVMPQEGIVGGEFLVSVKADVDISHAMATDEVANTVSYADIYDIVRREMMQPSRLLEHAAGRIATALLSELPAIEAVEVALTKENPPMGAACQGAGVQLRMTRK